MDPCAAAYGPDTGTNINEIETGPNQIYNSHSEVPGFCDACCQTDTPKRPCFTFFDVGPRPAVVSLGVPKSPVPAAVHVPADNVNPSKPACELA